MPLRVLVLGGTRFIGRAIVDELVDAGHDVRIVHRGNWEPPDLPDVPHLHADRNDLGAVRGDVEAFAPEAIVDCAAIGAPDTDNVLGVVDTLRSATRLAVLSSMDTYRAYGALHAGTVTDALPLDETSPVRTGDQRYPYRGQIPGMDDYEKLDVEERWLGRGGTVLRLPMTYGERDYQRREEFILRRVRAGRERIPIGAGNALFTHGYVGDVARGVRLALEADRTDVGGEIFNLGETRTPTTALRARWILEAADAADRIELVRVPDETLPPDLGMTSAIDQHLLVDSGKARRVLGWAPDDAMETLRRSVRWHLDNPPQEDEAATFDDDDRALEAAKAESAEPSA
ncbi:MAG TPA: NAD-dependent epimerase/dehydratase family protein [Acidimicrobiales bacterium]|nr:NAD-dependent epimerase/dehydratase family protein [Acidimicrobiales bacterium]